MPKIKKPKKAANLAREIWRLHGICENCGAKAKDRQMQGAHILGVGSHPRIQADVRNGFCLCSVCHRRFHDNSYDFNEFIEGSWAERYIKTLRSKAIRKFSDPKIDWDLKIDQLKEIKRAIIAGELTIEQARELEE